MANLSINYNYSQLGNIAAVLGSIDDKQLQQGFEIQVRSDNTLKFVQPGRLQRAKAYTTSTYNGVSQRDQKMAAVLEQWLANCRTCDTFSAGSMGLDQDTKEAFINAFTGLITLGNFYITTFSQGKSPYYQAKMETAKKVLNVALQYHFYIFGVGKKVPITTESDEQKVSTQYGKLKSLIETHFSKKTEQPEQSSQKLPVSQSQASQSPAYAVPATVVSSEQTGTGEFPNLAQLMKSDPGLRDPSGISSPPSDKGEQEGGIIMYPSIEIEAGTPSQQPPSYGSLYE